MLVIEIEFTAGRYHATPWGRNVNEGEVEWPPSPYRLARAAIDVWKRKIPDLGREKVIPVLQALSGAPKIKLPPATSSHTRSFLNSNDYDPFKKQKIFDSFVVLGKKEKTVMGFDTDLEPESKKILYELLSMIPYLGRSESWVRATLVDDKDIQWNCVPIEDSTGKPKGEIIPTACTIPWVHYKPINDKSWYEALCMNSSEYLRDGWSNPPALIWVDYVRQHNALEGSSSGAPKLSSSCFCCAKYALESTVLPRVNKTLAFSERIRRKMMGIHKRILGGDSREISRVFCGKDEDGNFLTGHSHAFYLPLDEDGDGRIDHLIVASPEPFTPSELKAIDILSSIWQPKGLPDINLILISLTRTRAFKSSRRWVSATPFVTSRHYRKGRGDYSEWIKSEIRRECSFHDLPEPLSITMVPETLLSKMPIKWMQFDRNRKNDKPLTGHGCIMEFERPVAGPFAIGTYCHFGLGLFAEMTEDIM